MFPISMKQLSHLLTLLFVLFNLNSKAQIDIQEDLRVDTLLKQVAAKRPGLTMFGRKDVEKYVNMAVLADSTRTLTWFTCYGQAFDVTRLTDELYSKVKSGSLNPFDYYGDYFFDLLSVVRDAAAQFRQKGEAVLKDTDNIYYRVYSYPPIQQARSMLQKEVAMERIMGDLYLKRALFDNPTPQKLIANDSFQLRLKLAGRMIQQGDTTSYYNTNPLSSAARIMLCKQAPGKMFVYDRQGKLADSVPLKAGKYTALLNEKEDVFLLYRGWLELQSQQAIASKEEVAKLLNREYTMLYKPVYWAQHKQQLQQTLSEVQEQIDAASSKVMGLILPDPKETVHLLAAVYQEKPAEISYISGIGFAYSVVYFRGNKRYELADHRGNVMAIVSDKKKGIDENGDGSLEYYNADVVNAVDYFPFGSQMPGRTYSGEDKYRYGFNGKENDDEVKGEGNQQDYGLRIYDTRIGRFLSMDMLYKDYPELTPYQFASNTPIRAVDLDGGEMKDAMEASWGLNTAERRQDIRQRLAKKDGKEWLLAPAAVVSVATVSVLGLSSSAVATIGAKLTNIALWASNPVNQQAIVGVAGAAASLLDPSPNTDYPGNIDDVIRGGKLLLGKSYVLRKYANSADDAFHMFKEGFGLGVPRTLSQSNQLLQAMYATMKEGKKIAFDVTDVTLDLAKKGFKNFDAADEAGKITEWELSKVLRDKELFDNTIFHKAGKEVSAKELGLQFIEE